MRGLIIFLIGFISIPGIAQFKNITIVDDNGTSFIPRNPSVAINRKDPLNMVIGVSNRAYVTLDGGTTWTESSLGTSIYGGGKPVLLSDQKGNLFCFQQSDKDGKGSSDDGWLDRIVCQESSNNGETWKEEVYFGINPPKDQNFFHITTHSKKSILYATWTQFDSYRLEDANCQSNVLYSMSMNGGGKWTRPIQVSQTPGDCKDDDNTAVEATPAVGFDGKIFTAWYNQGNIFFDRSYDGGETWLSNDLAIHKLKGGRSMMIPGFGRVNLSLQLVSDISPTRAQGHLYIVYADQQKKDSNESDIYMIRSVNRGDNWTTPLRINNDEPGKYHFSQAVALDQTSGYMYVLYYDRRAYDDNRTDVYLAYSVNAGDSFSEVKISETSFDPKEMKIESGYLSLSAHDGVVVPVWTRIDGNKVSILTSIIKIEDLRKANTK
ncbi:hypothetical protein BH09BAC3_BH09BAC3_20010 [soil metagenome]